MVTQRNCIHSLSPFPLPRSPFLPLSPVNQVNAESSNETDDSKNLLTWTLKSVFLYMKEFLADIWGVLSNKLWLCCFVGDLFTSFGWGGIFLFLPKTLEVQVWKDRG